MRRDGWKELLDCPSCGEPCEAIAPFKPTYEHPYPNWEDGQTGTCKCGEELVVIADGERAYLKEVNE